MWKDVDDVSKQRQWFLQVTEVTVLFLEQSIKEAETRCFRMLCGVTVSSSLLHALSIGPIT